MRREPVAAAARPAPPPARSCSARRHADPPGGRHDERRRRSCGPGMERRRIGRELVGVRGFEPPAPASRKRCSTRLSYTPARARYNRSSAATGKARRRAVGALSSRASRQKSIDLVERLLLGAVAEDGRARGAPRAVVAGARQRRGSVPWRSHQLDGALEIALAAGRAARACGARTGARARRPARRPARPAG